MSSKSEKSGLELIKLQKFLKKEKLCFKSEQDSLQEIQDEITSLMLKLQKDMVECTNINKILENLSIANVEYLIPHSKGISNPWKVELYEQNSPLTTNEFTQYQEMIYYIRMNPRILAAAIIGNVGLSRRYLETLSQSSIFSVFGNAVTEEEELNLRSFLQDCLLEQLVIEPDPKFMLTSNKILSRILSAYCKITGSFQFLTSSLREPILAVIQETSLDLLSLQHESDKEQTSATGRLISFVNQFIKSIEEKISLVPDGIKWLANVIQGLCIKYKRESELNKILGDLLFVKFINPCIIAKILLSLCYGHSSLRTSNQLFGDQMNHLNIDISNIFRKITQISERYNLDSKKTNSPKKNINKTIEMPKIESIIISPNDLFVLHSLLFEYATEILPTKEDQSHLRSPVIQLILSFGKPPKLLEEEENKYINMKLNIETESILPKQVVDFFSRIASPKSKRPERSRTAYVFTQQQSNQSNQPKKIEKKDTYLIDEAERKLSETLCEMSFINSNNNKGKTFIEILQSERDAAHAVHSLNISCLIDSTLKSLEKLPKSIKKKGYLSLMWKMKTSHLTRQNLIKKIVTQRYEYQNILNKLKEISKRTLERMSSFNHFVKSLLASKFIEKHEDKLEGAKNKILNSNNLPELESSAQYFFNLLSSLLKTEPLVRLFPESIPILTTIVENYVLMSIYENIFYPNFLKDQYQNEDELFSIKVTELREKISSDFLQIPKRFFSKEIWIFAIEGKLKFI
ncbi:gtpase-activating protein [Anaeramoeba ignava]|uniref:Gtpase-activating protein n=1 Tax=Anaeramoeba ignava TaxID=1746090 RepID=A0A9Q0R9D3_ANAIG|nr:gtpase-activating protein [Anaeramoeba ignava]